VSTTSAQEVHLVLENQKLTVNGEEVSLNSLPEGLDLQGVNLDFYYRGSGDVRWPTLSIGGLQYEVSDQGVELVVFPPTAIAAQAIEEIFINEDADFGQDPTWMSEVMEQVELFSRDLEAGFPLHQALDYFGQVSASDLGLYRQLADELVAEQQVKAMALMIREMPTGEARDLKEKALRQELEALFELKQENRRREIQKIEDRLQKLRKDVEEREALRGRMIERRMQYLLNQVRNP